MKWSAKHDTLFGREILSCELWKHRSGTRVRGNCLDEICEILSNIKELQFCVSEKSLREHLKIVEKDSERGSGISLKYREIDPIMEDYLKRREEEEAKLTNKSTDDRNKESQDKAAGEEMRLRKPWSGHLRQRSEMGRMSH